MYLFQISNYDDPAVDRETAELLHQRLEAESRRRCPSIWNAIDRIRTHAAKGPGREKRTVRYRIYGLFLLALGLLMLILGLMPPKTTDVIIAGAAAIIAGLLEFALVRRRTPPRIPASCKKEARKALELRRTVDWEKLKTTVRFEDAGITICAEENEEHLSYTRIAIYNRALSSIGAGVAKAVTKEQVKSIALISKKIRALFIIHSSIIDFIKLV